MSSRVDLDSFEKKNKRPKVYESLRYLSDPEHPNLSLEQSPAQLTFLNSSFLSLSSR
jgi:hypothetical protein